MEQQSDVEYRAEKLYKNSREKFGYLIRETVANAFHSTIIKKSKTNNDNYNPKVKVEIQIDEHSGQIVINDNGEGFNDKNRKYFTHLDTRNDEKEKLNFHPQGQGRLAILFFTDHAHYKSVYSDNTGCRKFTEFMYPELGPSLFNIETFNGIDTDATNTETVLTMSFTKHNTFSREATFFKKYDDINKLRNWFLYNFFPFFMDDEDLVLEILFNQNPIQINKRYIEEKVSNIPFHVKVSKESDDKESFRVWLIQDGGSTKPKTFIQCFARKLIAELEEGKLEYEIDLTEKYNWLLTSQFFDDNVNQKG